MAVEPMAVEPMAVEPMYSFKIKFHYQKKTPENIRFTRHYMT